MTLGYAVKKELMLPSLPPAEKKILTIKFNDSRAAIRVIPSVRFFSVPVCAMLYLQWNEEGTCRSSAIFTAAKRT
jgi:hypothetical protein